MAAARKAEFETKFSGKEGDGSLTTAHRKEKKTISKSRKL
jgi:hypothetical protein